MDHVFPARIRRHDRELCVFGILDSLDESGAPALSLMLGGDQTLHIALAGLASPGGGGDRVVGASGVRAAGRPGRVVVLNSDSFRASACDQ